ncbi:MAG TPA: cation diffusion facilitator family transporter [Solirubrobacteraceae bacterium]|nr:cation diffusion facilitator family transporter [Solirubrobacteraceae bacterium]
MGAHAGHGQHRHAPPTADRRPLALALALILVFMTGEVVAGILASSLALLSDAAHMLTDAAALGLALVAAGVARRPAHGAMTFGMGRVEVLSAQANGIALLVLAVLIAIESVRRLSEPTHVAATAVLVVALVGVAVNALAARLLGGGESRSLNVEGAFRHVLTDLYAFLATGAAAVVILATGFQRADPIASLVVAALMLRSAYVLLRASGRVFMEAAPAGLDPQRIGSELAHAANVVEVHDLHVWEVTSGFTALSAHIVVPAGSDCHLARVELERMLDERFGIEHTTLQVDHVPPRELLEIDSSPGGGSQPSEPPRSKRQPEK